jgi:hypothetical protein
VGDDVLAWGRAIPMTKKLYIVLAGVMLFVTVAWGEGKYVLASKRLSSTEVAVSCANGADPTGQKIGNTLIISCGK